MNLKLILFVLLLIIIPVSNAETIVGSTMELVNGSGSFTWTSQNFPALRDGDSLTLRVENNTLYGISTVINILHRNPKDGLGLTYQMKLLSFNDILSENFPSSIQQNFNDGNTNYNYKECINYLTNNYCRTNTLQYNGIVIDKNSYHVHEGDKFVIEGMSFNIESILKDIDKIYVVVSGGGYYLKGYVSTVLFYNDNNYNSIAMGKARLLVYIKETYSDSADFQGFVQIFREGMIIPEYYGKLFWCCGGDRNFFYLSNKDDILLSDGINDMSDELKIVKNGNSIYPSANIVKRTLNVQYIPKPTPSPTPIPTTPIQTPTPTITITSTSTPTPSPTPTPTITQITTPTPTSTSPLEQEVKELKERLNKTEEKQSQQESRISWLESTINSFLNWLKSIF